MAFTTIGKNMFARSEQKEQKESKHDDWICRCCTYNNASVVNVCYICNTNRNITDEIKGNINDGDSGDETEPMDYYDSDQEDPSRGLPCVVSFSKIPQRYPKRNRNAPTRFADQQFLPGANNGFTNGRTCDPYDRKY